MSDVDPNEIFGADCVEEAGLEEDTVVVAAAAAAAPGNENPLEANDIFAAGSLVELVEDDVVAGVPNEKNLEAAELAESDENPLGNTGPLLAAANGSALGADAWLPLPDLDSRGVVQQTQFVASLAFGTKHVEHVHLPVEAVVRSGLAGAETSLAFAFSLAGPLLAGLAVEQHTQFDALLSFGTRQVEHVHLLFVPNNSLNGFSG